jgi:hypothetical protein
MDFEFSSGTPAGGPSPWMRATFDDGGGSGSVTLKMENLNLVGTEFVRNWHFNLDPTMDPTSLVFSAPTKVGAFTDPTNKHGVDAFKPTATGSTTSSSTSTNPAVLRTSSRTTNRFNTR